MNEGRNRMMERLTKHGKTSHENGICCTHFRGKECNERFGDCTDNCPWEEAVWSKLATYEDAEEQGLLLRLPCKVGTTIYIINRYWIDEGNICGIAEADDIDCFCYKVYCDPDDYTLVAVSEFKETWFLNEEEAERKLQEMKGGAE